VFIEAAHSGASVLEIEHLGITARSWREGHVAVERDALDGDHVDVERSLTRDASYGSHAIEEWEKRSPGIFDTATIGDSYLGFPAASNPRAGVAPPRRCTRGGIPRSTASLRPMVPYAGVRSS